MTRPTWAGLFATAAMVALTRAAGAQQTVNLNTGFLPDPHRTGGTAGGPVQAQTVQANCRGWIPAQPNQVLITPTGFNFLRVFVESQGDTTMMIRGINQTWCADDTYGLNPGIDLQSLPPGRYDIYVGSYATGQMFPYQLAMSELSTSVPGNNTGGYQPPPQNTMIPQPPPRGGNGGDNGILNPNGSPNFGRVIVPPVLRRALTATGRSGGSQDGSVLRGQGICRGYITPQPDHQLVVSAAQPYLHLFVLSAADTTLIVRQPDGSLLCNDDTYNLNPSIEGTFQPGVYQVWVGGYHAGEVRPYRLTVTNNPTQHP